MNMSELHHQHFVDDMQRSEIDLPLQPPLQMNQLPSQMILADNHYDQQYKQNNVSESTAIDWNKVKALKEIHHELGLCELKTRAEHNYYTSPYPNVLNNILSPSDNNSLVEYGNNSLLPTNSDILQITNNNTQHCNNQVVNDESKFTQVVDGMAILLDKLSITEYKNRAIQEVWNRVNSSQNVTTTDESILDDLKNVWQRNHDDINGDGLLGFTPNKRKRKIEVVSETRVDENKMDAESTSEGEDLAPDGSDFTVDNDTLMQIQPMEEEEVTSIPTPTSSSVSNNITTSQQVQSPSRRAILQDMVLSGTTSEQAALLKQVDLQCIEEFEAIAFGLIDDKKVRMVFEELPDDVIIESVPLLDCKQPSQSQSSGIKAPLFISFTRGSIRTNNTTTTQVVHSLTAGMVGVRCRVLPKDTEVCTMIVGGLESSRHKTKEATAVINLRKILHRVDKDRQVFIAAEESLRVGLKTGVIEDILLDMRGIHDKTKVLFVTEGGLHPSDTSSIHQDYSEDYQRITLECGSQKNPRDKSVQVSGDDKVKQDENDEKAAEMKKRLLHLRDTKQPLPDQLLKGAERGRDSQHNLGPVMAELVNIKEDLECLQTFDGDEVSNETVMSMLQPFIAEEDGSIKMAGILQRCSSAKSYEETEKVGGILAQQYSKNFCLGKKKGLIDDSTLLVITNTIRGRGASGFNIDGHDDLVKMGALITMRRLSVLLSTTTIRGGLNEIELMILDNLCTMTGIEWDLSEEIGRDIADVIAAGKERRRQLDIRLETKKLAMKELVDKLSDDDKTWNRVMSMIGSRNLKKEQHRFKDELKEAIEKRRLGRSLLWDKERAIWKQAKEAPSKLKDDDAIHLVNNYCFKRMRYSTLKSSSLSVSTDVHSWAMNQPPISSPEEAMDIITNVMSKRRQKKLTKKEVNNQRALQLEQQPTQQLPQIQQQQLQLQLQQQKIQEREEKMKTYTVKVPEGIGPDMPFDVSIKGQRMTITCPFNAQAGTILSFQFEVKKQCSLSHDLAAIQRSVTNAKKARENGKKVFIGTHNCNDECLITWDGESRHKINTNGNKKDDIKFNQARCGNCGTNDRDYTFKSAVMNSWETIFFDQKSNSNVVQLTSVAALISWSKEKEKSIRQRHESITTCVHDICSSAEHGQLGSTT